MKSFLGRYWFIFGMIFSIILAGMIPDIAMRMNSGGIASNSCVVVIFFLLGISLSTQNLKQGVAQVKLHVFLQVFIFAIVPIYFYFTSSLLEAHMPEAIRFGVYALAVLPTTVSSCVFFTQMFGGNTAVAIFNASLSNFMGILLSPFILTLFLKDTSASMSADTLLHVFLALTLKIVLPFIVGQISRRFLKDIAKQYSKSINQFCYFLILWIIFFSVAKAASHPSMQNLNLQFVWPMVYLALSHILLIYISIALAKALGYTKEYVTATAFIAPQKTLAMGVPLMSTFFAHRPELIGMIILPTLFYHMWQLLVAGFAEHLPLLGVQRKV